MLAERRLWEGRLVVIGRAVALGLITVWGALSLYLSGRAEGDDTASAPDQAGPVAPGALGGREPSEEEVVALVERAGRGDAEAFGKLYDRYLDQIYRYVYYRVRNTAEAEDLTEEIFLKAWDGIGRYHQRGVPFRAWLIRLARNHLIDRSRTRREAVPLEETVPATEPEPSEVALRKLDAEAMRQLMGQLTEEQREVIFLKFIEDLSTKEIAEATGRQEGAVRALQMRGLQTLRRLIESTE